MLRCVKENSRLAVKIINTGFDNNLNCSFPPYLKEEGAIYGVKSCDISLNKNLKYYNLKNKTGIRRIDNWPKGDPIFVENYCVVCLGDNASCILLNCGHLCACISCFQSIVDNCEICMQCATKHIKCPICRSKYRKNFVVFNWE